MCDSFNLDKLFRHAMRTQKRWVALGTMAINHSDRLHVEPGSSALAFN